MDIINLSNIDLCDHVNDNESFIEELLENITCNGSTVQPPNITNIPEPRITNWFYFMVNNTIVCFILSGNLMTLAIMIHYRQLRTVTNTFVISLAGADLIMGFIYPLYNILNYTTYAYSWNTIGIRKFPCATCLYCIILSAGISNFSLLAVSVDRYIAVLHPLTYRMKVTTKRASIAIVLIWTYIIFATLSMVPVYGLEPEEYYNMSCSLLNLIPKWYFFGIIIPHMLIPNIISKILYCKILYVAKKQARKIYQENKLILGSKATKSENKSTTTMALILVLFVICWAPYITLHIVIHSIGRSSPDWLFNLLEISKILSLSNSFINPIIYVWKNKDFRYALKLRCRDWGKNSVGPSERQSRSHSLSSNSNDTTASTESCHF